MPRDAPVNQVNEKEEASQSVDFAIKNFFKIIKMTLRKKKKIFFHIQKVKK
jgi:hypothetical protein